MNEGHSVNCSWCGKRIITKAHEIIKAKRYKSVFGDEHLWLCPGCDSKRHIWETACADAKAPSLEARVATLEAQIEGHLIGHELMANQKKYFGMNADGTYSNPDPALAQDYHAPRGTCGSCRFSFVPEDGDDAPSFCRSDHRGGYRALPFIKVFGEDEEGSCGDWDAVDGWKATALGAEPKEVLESEPPQSILTYGSCPICGGRVMCSKGSPLSESHLISINGRWVRFCEGCGDAIIECNIEVKP